LYINKIFFLLSEALNLTFITEMHKNTRKRVFRKGKYDGRNWKWKFPFIMKDSKSPYPLIEQEEFASFELEIMKVCDIELSQIAEDWKKQDIKLKPSYCKSLIRFTKARDNVKFALRDLHIAQAHYNRAKEAFFKVPIPSLSKISELVIVFIIAIIEIPFNSAVFQIMGMSKIETYVMAGSFSVGIPLAAYFFGHMLRLKLKSLTHRLFLVIIPVFIVFVLMGIAVIRASYFEESSKMFGIDNLSPSTISAIFIGINLLLFMLAILASFAAAHEEPQLYKDLTRRYIDARDALKEEAKEHKETVEEYEDADSDFQQSHNNRKKILERLVATAKNRIDVAEWLVKVYRTANMDARDIKTKPKCFTREHQQPQLPSALWEANVDWECNNIENKTFGANPTMN